MEKVIHIENSKKVDEIELYTKLCTLSTLNHIIRAYLSG